MEETKRFLAPIYSTSVVQLVIDRISNAIIAGELNPGNKLPTEPELASLFQVGRNSVREAVRILIAYGVLEIRRPEGTFVCDNFSAKMINPMLYHIIMQKNEAYHDLVELRKMVENGMMHIVMEKGLSKQEETALQTCCQKLTQILQTTPDRTDAILDADIALHDQIARATHNSLIPIINSLIVELTKESRAKTISKIVQNGDAQYLIDTHVSLINVLITKDTVNLDRVISDSYFFWKDIYQ